MENPENPKTHSGREPNNIVHVAQIMQKGPVNVMPAYVTRPYGCPVRKGMGVNESQNQSEANQSFRFLPHFKRPWGLNFMEILGGATPQINGRCCRF